MENNKNKHFDLVVVLGPTGAGKTKLAVQLAPQLNGEIISGDSRQIYRGMDIGTGKDLEEFMTDGINIPYHLIDILDPHEDYSVYQFQQDYHRISSEISARNKLPILCGGTGLYIESVLLNYQMTGAKPDPYLREELESQSNEDLITQLEEIDYEFSTSWKKDTKQRIIRGIEIALFKDNQTIDNCNPIDLNKVLVIGVNVKRHTLREKITKRLKVRINDGMIEEVETLLSNGVSKERLEYFGLEYKFVSRYLYDEIDKEEMFTLLNIAIHQFAKRQRTWFRRMEKRGVNIHWIDSSDPGPIKKLLNL